jgi:hypothetical protein
MQAASCTRDQFEKVRAMLGQQAVCIAQIAKETGLTRQTSNGSRVTLRVLRRLWRPGDCEYASCCTQSSNLSGRNGSPFSADRPRLACCNDFKKCQ